MKHYQAVLVLVLINLVAILPSSFANSFWNLSTNMNQNFETKDFLGHYDLNLEDRKKALSNLNQQAKDFILSNNLLDRKLPITEALLKKIHRFISDGYDDGIHRMDDPRNKLLSDPNENYMGEYRKKDLHGMGTSINLLAEKMKQFIQWANKYEANLKPNQIEEFAAEFYTHLIAIHPFIDGNGRTARFLLNLLLLRHGKSAIDLKLIVWNSNVIGYPQTLKEDRPYFVNLIKEASKGIDTTLQTTGYGPNGRVFSQRYGKIGSNLTYYTLGGMLSQRNILSTDFLNFVRNFIDSDIGQLEDLINVFSRTRLTQKEFQTFLNLLRARVAYTTKYTLESVQESIHFFAELYHSRYPDIKSAYFTSV